MKYLLLLMVVNANILLAQKSFEIKYDETLYFEDSVELESYLDYFNHYRVVHSYEKIDEKILIEKDIYHIIYEDSLAKKKSFRMGYDYKIDTNYFFKDAFFYFQKDDKIFVKYLEQGEQKCHIQYDLKSTTKAKYSPTWIGQNVSYFHSEDYVNISNVTHNCYVFEEINDNYKRLIYISKEDGFLLKTITRGTNSNYFAIVEAYEINKTTTQN